MAPGASIVVFVAPNKKDGGYYISVMNAAINQIRALTLSNEGIQLMYQPPFTLIVCPVM